MPKEEKHGILDWIDEKTGGAITKVTEKADYVESAKEVAKQDVECFLVGGMIGAAEGAEGSDAPALLALALGGAGAIAASGHGVESHLRNVSSTGAGILGYKASRRFLYEKSLAAHGETFSTSGDKDAILAEAERLGFGSE